MLAYLHDHHSTHHPTRHSTCSPLYSPSYMLITLHAHHSTRHPTCSPSYSPSYMLTILLAILHAHHPTRHPTCSPPYSSFYMLAYLHVQLPNSSSNALPNSLPNSLPNALPNFLHASNYERITRVKQCFKQCFLHGLETVLLPPWLVIFALSRRSTLGNSGDSGFLLLPTSFFHSSYFLFRTE